LRANLGKYWGHRVTAWGQKGGRVGAVWARPFPPGLNEGQRVSHWETYEILDANQPSGWDGNG